MKKWSCTVCGRLFQRDRALRKHVVLVHRMRYDRATGTAEPFPSTEAEETAYFSYRRAQLPSRRRHRLDAGLYMPQCMRASRPGNGSPPHGPPPRRAGADSGDESREQRGPRDQQRGASRAGTGLAYSVASLHSASLDSAGPAADSRGPVGAMSRAVRLYPHRSPRLRDAETGARRPPRDGCDAARMKSMIGAQRVTKLATVRDSRLPRFSSGGSPRPLIAKSRERRLRRIHLQPPWAGRLATRHSQTLICFPVRMIYRPRWPT